MNGDDCKDDGLPFEAFGNPRGGDNNDGIPNPPVAVSGDDCKDGGNKGPGTPELVAMYEVSEAFGAMSGGATSANGDPRNGDSASFGSMAGGETIGTPPIGGTKFGKLDNKGGCTGPDSGGSKSAAMPLSRPANDRARPHRPKVPEKITRRLYNTGQKQGT